MPGVQFQQLTVEHQARQVPVGALAASDQYVQVGVVQGQELVEPVVQISGQLGWQVVENQTDLKISIVWKGLIASRLAPTVDRVPL
ncbi:hypothetical protein D3C85_1324510 [compost metagenome]